jgi:AcrR family transcriptional regulator
LASRVIPTQSRLPRGRRKQQIVEIVLDLISQRGVEAVSIQLIADTIGISQPAVFRHFQNKEAIWTAVMDWLEEQLGAIYSDANVQHDAAEPVVFRRMFLEHIRLIERYPALAKLVFADNLRLEYPMLQERFAIIHRRYTARLIKLIDRGKLAGTVSHSVASRYAATTFLCLVQGLAFQFAIARLPMRLLPDSEQVLGLYLKAIAADA